MSGRQWSAVQGKIRAVLSLQSHYEISPRWSLGSGIGVRRATATDPREHIVTSGILAHGRMTREITSHVDAALGLAGARPPGTELAYSVVFTNGGAAPAYAIVLQEVIPNGCDFNVGSSVTLMGTTGLTPTVAYSNNSGATWTYAPASGVGGAPAGFDRTVTNIRWTLAGTLGNTAPANQGTVGFTVRVQ